MKKVFFLFSFYLFFTACEKNPLWVGKKEFFTIDYSNSSIPLVSTTPTNKSPFIDVDKISTVNLGNGTVQVIAEGIRIQSKSNNFEIETIAVYEKDKKKFEVQDEFNNLSSSNKTDIATVLVLDMSTSLGDLVINLKDYAKNFVDKVVNSTDNSKVAVVFFSGKNDISITDFYDISNSEVLKSLIDNYTNYQPRTALFEATMEGISLLDNLNFSGSKALVVFTDGGDNDSDNPQSLQTSISASNYLRISIGLQGDDFDKEDLESIADSKSNSIVANKEEKLKDIFETVARQIVSVYTVVYERSDQIISNNIEIKFEFEVDKIK